MISYYMIEENKIIDIKYGKINEEFFNALIYLFPLHSFNHSIYRDKTEIVLEITKSGYKNSIKVKQENNSDIFVSFNKPKRWLGLFDIIEELPWILSEDNNLENMKKFLNLLNEQIPEYKNFIDINKLNNYLKEGKKDELLGM